MVIKKGRFKQRVYKVKKEKIQISEDCNSRFGIFEHAHT
jgi:hypothetical protein